jgi:3-deoxy-7-phosphoheptulonate synthase
LGCFSLALERFDVPFDSPTDWSPESFRNKLQSQQIVYPDRDAVGRAVGKLKSLPPLVTSFEIERLKTQIAEAQLGKRFLLWGGDCAEQIDDCSADAITRKLKILLQMSLVLVYASKAPVIRVGRFAGQYAKPRSSPTETRTIDGTPVTLPSYYGDLVNGAAFTPESRTPDPMRMVEGYTHAAMTLNFIRSLLDGGFADVHHPEYWDLGFMKRAGLPEELRGEYARMTERLAEGLKFMEAIGERTVEQLTRVEFFASHEGLNLLYESAQTRGVPRRKGFYNLSTHLPWLGERTRQIDGAHVEYFRGVRNPIGVKLGPSVSPDDAVALIRRLNPQGEPGRMVIICRMGAKNVKESLPKLLERVQSEKDLGPVLWVCDPMHGNTVSTSSGIKTRLFRDVRSELEAAWDIHAQLGTRLGGMHVELTGEDVTECLGGARGLGEDDLSKNYASLCDPRLNYEQALELSFGMARRMGG